MRKVVFTLFTLIYLCSTLGISLVHHVCLMRKSDDVRLYTGGTLRSCCAPASADGITPAACCHTTVEQTKQVDQSLRPLFLMEALVPLFSVRYPGFISVHRSPLSLVLFSSFSPGCSPPLLI